jgi:hypothetical protein
MTVRHAWLQKHPSPIASDGTFHWYPAIASDDGPELVERLRGVTPPAVLWSLAPGRVVWAQTFAATAPVDGRRYVGLVASIVEGEGTAAQLLASLAPPPAGPWLHTDDAPALARHLARANPSHDTGLASLGADPPVMSDPRGAVIWPAVARALLDGGAAPVGDPSASELAARIASLEAILPASVSARARRGVWTAGEPATASDAVAELALAAWRGDAAADRAWRMLGELARVRGTSLDAVAAVLSGDAADALSVGERETLGDARDLVRVLHAWGRGRFDRSPDAATLPVRLADALALRVLASCVAGADPGVAIAAARWYALLPAGRRRLLLDTAIARVPALAEVTRA